MASRFGRAARLGCALALALGCGACKTLTQQLEREIFAETLELTMDRPSDLLPPEALRVLSTEDRGIDLAWDPVLVGDVAGYAVLRAKDLVGIYELVGRTTSRFGTIYNDRGETDEQLGDGQTYYYRIHPYDRSGRVSRSHAFIAATTEGRPDAPKSLRTYSNLPRKVVLVWEPNDRRSTAGYRILRSPTVAGPWEEVGYSAGRLRSIYEDEVPGDLRVMYYRLVATNRFGGESDPTEPVRAVTKAEPLPPVGLQVAGRQLGEIELVWAPNVESDLAHYEVWRADASDGELGEERKVAEVDASATRFADPDIGCGQRVRYRLRARDWDGLASGYSAALETQGLGIGLEFVPSANGAHVLRWDPVATSHWTAARVRELRGSLPDRDIALVRGASSASLAELGSGRRRLAVVPVGGENGAKSEAAPLCTITVEIP